MKLDDYYGIIESCYGFTDESSPVGEAWNAVKKEVNRLQEENKEWNDSFELFYRAGKRADVLYREAHPDYPPLNVPSLHRVWDWMIDDRERLREENEKLKAMLE